MDFVDDASNKGWCIPVRTKDEAFARLQAWETAVVAETGESVGIYCTDNGGELKSNQMQAWCDGKGITHQFTAPYTSAENGRVERRHLTIFNKAHTSKIACDTPDFLWDEFAVTANYLHNLTPSSANNGKTPYELWTGRRPDLSGLREVGCKAFVLVETHNSKLRPRSFECVLIGYEPNLKAYRLWHRPTGKVVVSRNVTFIERKDDVPSPFHPGLVTSTDTIPSSSSSPFVPPIPVPSSVLPTPILPTPIDSLSTHAPIHHPPSLPIPNSVIGPDPAAVRRSSRLAARSSLVIYGPPLPPLESTDPKVLLADLLQVNVSEDECPMSIEFPEDPASWEEAMGGEDAEDFCGAAMDELKSLVDMGVFKLIPPEELPVGRRPLRCRLVCTRKRNEVGQVVRHKVRCVVKGFEQLYGYNYSKTTSPTSVPNHSA